MKNFLNTGMGKILGVLIISASFFSFIAILTTVPTTIDDFFLPGSQDGQSGNLEHPSKCDNCHGGYDLNAEPAFNWRGSMMAQAARDPLYFATVTIANQDAPGSGDLCIRCHAPDGWLNGRSVPTDGSALNSGDIEGVKCDFCHKLIKPTPLGENPYPDDPFYTANTFEADQAYLAKLSHIPPTEGNGMFIADDSNNKRGPFEDADAKHKMYYSPFHKESGICGTCHDVSNPAFTRQEDGTYTPNTFGQPFEADGGLFDPANPYSQYNMFPVERTFSEWKMSAYNTEQGVYAPQFGGNKDYVSTCQDCHMRDVTGKGANKRGLKNRVDMPLHDMTGGNTFVPDLVEHMFPGDVDPAALAAGKERARYMLQNAATLEVNVSGQLVDVRVINETGHKLPSGYPEGRRIWINVKAYNEDGIVAYESGKYDDTVDPESVYDFLDHDADVKIYEIKPGPDAALAGEIGLPAEPSFHFVLNNTIYSDNRIPPRGFSNAAFEEIQSPPVEYSYADGQYWDDTQYDVGFLPSKVEVTLYYQTLSKPYVTFLRDENRTNTLGDELYDMWRLYGMSEPEEMEEVEIVLSSTPPVADFSYNTSGLSASFTDLSTGNPSSWQWAFGDGNTSTEQNPSHTYAAAGTYTVSLIAINEGGQSDPASANILLTVQSIVDIQSFFMSVQEITQKGNRANGQALIKVTDLGDLPIAGAVVTAGYEGPAAGTATGTTDADGIAVLETKSIKGASADDWCFTITGIVLEGHSWIGTIASSCGKAGKVISESEAFSQLSLGQNYPNPFSTFTSINFTLPEKSDVKLEIYSTNGQMLTRIVDQFLPAGHHKIEIDSDGIPNGIYYYRMVAGDNTLVRKMIVNK